jgi:hypothetical protein
MPIVCKICSAEFNNSISWSHLRTHNTTTEEYKQTYGKDSLTSNEYRQLRSAMNTGENNPNYGKNLSDQAKKSISEKNKGKTAWNKGIVHEDTSTQKLAAERREQRYHEGLISRPSRTPLTDETKQKISDSIKAYAIANPTDLTVRAQKSLETKRERGYDLGFFKGHKHSDASRKKISESSKRTAAQKSARAEQNMLEKISAANLTLLNHYSDDMLELQCNTCNSKFSHTHQMFHPSKFKIGVCRVCYPREVYVSRGEKELFEFVKALCPDAIGNYRYLGCGEVDVFIPSLNLAIEYNGLYWHSEQVLTHNGRSPRHDFEKFLKLESQGIRCITIFEDEWDNKREIAQARLQHILGKNNTKIQARKCVVQEITSKDAAAFCKQHHIQAQGRSNSRFGLLDSGTLVAVMTFSKNNISRRITQWELNRYCTLPDVTVIGGAGKLFKAFVKKEDPEQVITYSDRRWSVGNLYQQLGFGFIQHTAPGYWYIQANDTARYHRYSLRKNSNDNSALTEWENRQLQGWNRIWDCGNTKWLWTKENRA